MDDGWVAGENSGQGGAAEKGQGAHGQTGHQGSADAVKQGLAGAVRPSRAVVLSHEGGDGLHVGRGDQHQKDADLFRHSHGGGLGYALPF